MAAVSGMRRLQVKRRRHPRDVGTPRAINDIPEHIFVVGKTHRAVSRPHSRLFTQQIVQNAGTFDDTFCVFWLQLDDRSEYAKPCCHNAEGIFHTPSVTK